MPGEPQGGEDLTDLHGQVGDLIQGVAASLGSRIACQAKALGLLSFEKAAYFSEGL